MKKALALILALLMALSLVACGGGTDTPNDTNDIPEKPEGPITIQVSVAQKGDGFTVLTDAAAAFNASQSDYVVDLYYGGSYTEIMTIMQTSAESDRPDIFASSGNDTALYIAMADKMYIRFRTSSMRKAMMTAISLLLCVPTTSATASGSAGLWVTPTWVSTTTLMFWSRWELM